MLRVTLRGLLAHRLRLALAAFAVVLGVAFVSGTLVLSDTLNRTFDDLFATTTGGIDVVVRGASQGAERRDQRPPIPTSILGSVRRTPGVSEAFGQLQRQAAIIGADGKVAGSGGAPTIGLLWDPYDDMRSLQLRSGRPPTGSTEVVIDQRTSSVQHVPVGTTVRIQLADGAPRAFTVVGTAGFGSQDSLAGATVAAFDAKAGPALLGDTTEFDSIDVRATAGLDAATLRVRVAAAVPDGVEVVTGREAAQQQADQVRTGLSFLTTFLLVFALISVFVGSFIILNTFSILVAQRQRELALLRALGASRGQVLRSVLLESAVTGLTASIVGCAMGILIAKGLEALLATVGLDLGGTSLEVRPRTVVVSLLVGTVVTVGASLVPARRATRAAPVEALRDSVPAVTAVTRLRIISGVVLAVVGLVLLGVGLFVLNSNQIVAVGIGAFLTFVGVAVLAPMAVPPVVLVLGGAVSLIRRGGVTTRLAGDNARRNPRRTASTASALMIGVGLVSCFTVVGASLKDDINALVAGNLRADYVVSPQQTFLSAVSPQVARDLARVAGVGVVSEAIQGEFHIGNEGDELTAVDPLTVDRVASVTIRQGVGPTGLSDADVAVSEDAARAHSLRVGDTLSMRFARGPRSQHVAAIYAHNGLLGDYVVTVGAWRAASIDQNATIVMVSAAAGTAPASLRPALTAALSGYPGIQVQDGAQFAGNQGQGVDVLLNIITVLVVLAIIIALLGVVNTMALAIVERTRELGLIRALGMTRRQTRVMVRWETVIITLFGTLLGIAVGLVFGAALTRAIVNDAFNLALGKQVFYVVIAFVAGLAAAVFPARRASRVDMLAAIATE